MKRTTLEIRINDRFLLGEIDNALHTIVLERNSVPDGKKTIIWLESLFTAHVLKKHRDKLHYIKTFVAKKIYPQIIDILRNTQSSMNSLYLAEKEETARAEHYRQIFDGLKVDDKTVALNVIISPPVMLFIAIITLTDNIIRQLRVQYLCGLRSKKDFYRQRKTVLRRYAKVRNEIKEKTIKNRELIETLK
ncbi:hypothetical protein ACQZDD_004897 [Klebsiella aerogenes]|nr:hypothetical protein [Salmonella enterica]